MKFKQYINEDIDETVDEIAIILKKECMPFINEMKRGNIQSWFFRATEKKIDTIREIKLRVNRKPRNIPKEIHDYMDMLFKKHFGWKVRSEGVFATSDRYTISNIYGEPYLFFPMGKYKYVYHPQIGDIYNFFDVMYGISYGEEYIDIDKMKKKFDELISQYTSKKLTNAYESVVEVSFKCKSYYLVDKKYGGKLMKSKYGLK